MTYSKADVNGYLVQWPPTKEPVAGITPREVSSQAAVDEAVDALWDDEAFRTEAACFQNDQAHYGSVHRDHGFAAEAVYDWLKDANRLTPKMVELGRKGAIGKIASTWLKKAIARKGWARQAIYGRAIEDGRAAAKRREQAAAAREAPKADQPEA